MATRAQIAPFILEDGQPGVEFHVPPVHTIQHPEIAEYCPRSHSVASMRAVERSRDNWAIEFQAAGVTDPFLLEYDEATDGLIGADLEIPRNPWRIVRLAVLKAGGKNFLDLLLWRHKDTKEQYATVYGWPGCGAADAPAGANYGLPEPTSVDNGTVQLCVPPTQQIPSAFAQVQQLCPDQSGSSTCSLKVQSDATGITGGELSGFSWGGTKLPAIPLDYQQVNSQLVSRGAVECGDGVVLEKLIVNQGADGRKITISQWRCNGEEYFSAFVWK